MRLFLLPISTRRSLIYCEPLSRSLPTSQQSYSERLIAKANETWAAWEKDPDSTLNWKKRTTEWGNMMFRKIPFEEWSLKSVPPRRTEQRKGQGGGTAAGQDQKVVVEFPGLYQRLCKDSVIHSMKNLVQQRQGLHRKRMWWSLLGMPATIPFAIVPIVPNLPFFYMTFRAYSHWRALSGCDHLSHLLETSVLSPKSSPTLDNLYTAGLLHPNRNSTRNAEIPSRSQSQAVADRLEEQTNGGQEDIMLLHGWNGKLMAESLGLPGLEVEIERAVEQVQASLNKDKHELQGEKEEVEALRRNQKIASDKEKKS